MGDSRKQICRLCLAETPADGCESIDQIKKEMLETLLIKINFDISDYAVACNDCQQKLQDTFDFKSYCIGTFFDSDSTAHEKVCLKNYHECRLCLSLIGDKEFNYLTDFRDRIPLKDMIRKCFPQMDLSIVREPLICKSCISGLEGYYEFMKSCHEAHLAHGTVAMVKIEGTLECKDGDEADEHVLIKEECPDAVSEVNATVRLEPKDNTSIKCEEVHINDELDTGVSPLRGRYAFETSYKDNMTKRKLKTKHCDPLAVAAKKFACHKCPYETDFKGHLNNHLLIHMDESEVEMYKCENCEYGTRFKSNLTRHMLTHRVPKAEKKFKCCKCQYETDFMSNLRKHRLTHNDQSEVEMHKCKICRYATRQEGNAIRHMLTHCKKKRMENLDVGNVHTKQISSHTYAGTMGCSKTKRKWICTSVKIVNTKPGR